MVKNLIDAAKKEGIEKIFISTLIRKDTQILLIGELLQTKTIYRFPTAEVIEGESIPAALQRAITEETGMRLKTVISYLGHYDLEIEGKKVRYYHFVTEVVDPYSIESNNRFSYAWLEVQEAVGHPISDQLREMLDQYSRIT